MKNECGSLEGRHVLVAEDSDDLWNFVEHFLRRAGARAERARNGIEAVDKALGSVYEMILMDVQMPLMDGLEATRILRESGFRGPILALTTNPAVLHAHDSLEAGCDEHVTKPIEGALLVQKVAEYCQATCK